MGELHAQTYCLRWNNHKSNLVEILDLLIHKECYVDCTIYVEGNEQFKAHRVVLAASSPYFQSILQDVPMDHCSILVPGVQPFEMKALIEYMYTGEVNVSETQIPRIIKIAEQLEVKGLFDMTDLRTRFERYGPPEEPIPAANIYNRNNGTTISPPIISATTTNVSTAQSSTTSPPYNYKMPYTNMIPIPSLPSGMSISGEATAASASSERTAPTSSHQPWAPQNLSNSSSSSASSAIPPPPPPPQHLQTAAAAMLSSVYESGSDMNPLKRKKISSITSMLMSRDTPILRNVLAQANTVESCQQNIPTMNERSDRQSTHSNGTDYSDKKMKNDMPQSPFTDKSYDDEPMEHMQNYSDSRLASYVPQQKPEWKRYKQYTRGDILAAIECVRNGMSALKASRQFGVPSRTLYDKVKKMGITTGRPMNRTMKRSPSSNGNSPAGFPYGISGTSSPYNPHNRDGSPPYNQHNPHDSYEPDEDEHSERKHNIPPTISQPAAALLDARFLQQALEAGGGDIAGREALHAMAFAAAAHAAVNGMSTSPGTHGTARSPSPSMLMKYMRAPPVSSPPNNNGDSRIHPAYQQTHSSDDRMSSSHRQSPSTRDHQLQSREEDNGGVEDLSMSKLPQRSPSPGPHSAASLGVIVPRNGSSFDENVLNMKREMISNADDEYSKHQSDVTI